MKRCWCVILASLQKVLRLNRGLGTQEFGVLGEQR